MNTTEACTTPMVALETMPLSEFRPNVVPELGLQSYEFWNQDAKALAKRKAAVEALASGLSDVLPIAYSDRLYDKEDQDTMLSHLFTIMRRSDEIDDPLMAEITYSTAAGRAAEIYLIQLSAKLNRLVDDGASDQEIARVAEQYREANEQIFGTVTSGEHAATRGEIWAQIEGKSCGPRAQHIVDELRNGFMDRGRLVAALPMSETRLPQTDAATVAWIKERILEKYQWALDAVQQYWDTVIVPRSEREETEPEFIGEDILVLCKLLLAEIDPDGNSGVKVVANPNSDTHAWDTPSMSVKVGMAERKNKIETVGHAFGILYHELLWHAGKSVGGLATGYTVLGSGMFTETDPGEEASYLTYEEGGGSLLQAILKGETNPDGSLAWEMRNIRHTLNLGLFMAEGRSVAEVQELGWRIGVLMNLKNGEDITDEKIAAAKRLQANQLIRVLRGSPARLPEGVPQVVMSKDHNYCKGRSMVTPLFTRWAREDDRTSFDNTHRTKADPTNRRQREAAARAGYPMAA